MAKMPDHKPGFHNLGLRIFQADSSQIEYLIGEQEVESECCHSCLQAVTRNFCALLKFLLPNEKSKALEEMEKVLKDFPRNLNTLANLAYMYNERKMIEKEDECRKMIDSTIKADTTKIEVARSLAEQGYIMMIDLHSETREGPEKTLNLFAEQIKEYQSFSRPVMEISNCEDILKYVSLIRKKLHGLQSNCHRETIQEKLQAMKKLRVATRLLEKLYTERNSDDLSLAIEVAVWKHYLGKSYIRISGGSSEISSKLDKKMYIEEAVKSLVSSLHLETDTADKNALRIVARTYAYIAFICILRNDLIKDDAYFKELVVKGINVSENPLLISMHAETLNKDIKDRVVLNKIGVIHTLKEKFDAAEKLFKASIEAVPNYNWFAYSHLCNLYLNKHVQRIRPESRKGPSITTSVASDLDMLKRAKEYGIKCLEMRKTSVTLFRVAKVCKYMGDLKEASEYLQTALRSHECERHPQIYAQLAHCWYETGEFKGAVHMMKIAITIEPKNLTDPLNFRDFLHYLLNGFREGIRKHGEQWKQKSAKLQEICCVIEEGYRKHKKRIKYQLIGVLNLYPHEFIEVLKELLKQRPTERRTKLVEMYNLAFEKREGKDVERRVLELQDDIHRFISKGSTNGSESAEELLYDRQNSKGTEAIFPLPKDYRYDFYVLMSSTERAWIENIFLDVIEKDYSMTETILKGRVYQHNDETRDVIKTCKMFVFVITEDFTANPRIKRMAQEIKKRCIDQEERRIIPITRENVQIPDFLTTLIPCDADEIFKIRNAICGLTYDEVDIEDEEEKIETDG